MHSTMCSTTAAFSPCFRSGMLSLNPQSQFLNLPLKFKLHSVSIAPLRLFNLQRLCLPDEFFSQFFPPKLPFSKSFTASYSLSSKNNLPHFFARSVLGFLIGSFIISCCFLRNPAVARTGRIINNRANMVEKGEDEMNERVLEDDPKNVDALKVVLYGKMRRGKTREAVKYVETLINVEPDEVEWRLLLAFCYEMMGQLGEAKTLLVEILEERPLLIKALQDLAMVMHKNHEGPAVFEMLNKSVDIACRDNRVTEERNIRILIGQMHVIRGELEDGLKKFQDLVDENPRDFRPYLFQGIIYSLLGKKNEAAKQLEMYQTLVPDEFPQRRFLDDVVLTATTKLQNSRPMDAPFSHLK